MSARRFFGLAPLAFLALALATRAGQSLDFDELFSVWLSSRPLTDLIHQANVDGFTPPLFYVLVKVVSFAGPLNEGLRVLPVLLAAFAVFLGLQASDRLFGPISRWPATLLFAGSAYLFTMAHELRPYSALLCCAFFFLGQLGGPTSGKSDLRAALAALIATTFSYLGVSMVVLWLFECRRRCTISGLLGVALLAVLLCAPGLLKAGNLGAAKVDSQIAWSPTGPALSSVLFGLAPVPFDLRIEIVGLLLLAALLVSAHYPERVATLAFLTRAFGTFTFSVFAFDAVVPIGFAARYFALPMSALLLLATGALARAGRAGLLAAVVILGLNGAAIVRYLTASPPVRENWRGAMARIEGRLGRGGVLLAFPFHHAAVAAQAYAPGLSVGGGYASRNGPLFWYEPPASFSGYSFERLKRIDNPGEVFERITRVSEVCVLTDEPDVRKTAALFTVFEGVGGAEPFDTGDPRLRALCRSRD